MGSLLWFGRKLCKYGKLFIYIKKIYLILKFLNIKIIIITMIGWWTFEVMFGFLQVFFNLNLYILLS